MSWLQRVQKAFHDIIVTLINVQLAIGISELKNVLVLMSLTSRMGIEEMLVFDS